MTLNQMKAVSNLYGAFTAIESTDDLNRENLTLAEYNELRQALESLEMMQICIVRSFSVQVWISSRANVQVNSYGNYSEIKLI